MPLEGLIKILAFPFSNMGIRSIESMLSLHGYPSVLCQTEIKVMGSHIASWGAFLQHGWLNIKDRVHSHRGYSSSWGFRQQPFEVG